MGSGDGGEEPSLIILINNLTSTESVTTGSCSSVVSMTTLVRSTFSGFVPVLHSYVVVLPFFKTCFKIGRLSFTGALQDLKQKIGRLSFTGALQDLKQKIGRLSFTGALQDLKQNR